MVVEEPGPGYTMRATLVTCVAHNQLLDDLDVDDLQLEVWCPWGEWTTHPFGKSECVFLACLVHCNPCASIRLEVLHVERATASR